MTLLNVALKQLGEQNVTNDTLSKISELLKKSNITERNSMIEDLNLSPRWIKELLLPLLNESII